MRYTKYFLFTSKEKPTGAINISHSTLVRGGFIYQHAAGIYNFLPIGFRVLNKIWKIVQEEMNRIGAFEILMPAIHTSELWEKTNRWNTMDNVMFKFQDKKGTKMVLGTTHEEIVTDIVSKYVKSYKNLPLLLYQIQVKFRDEIRPKGGLIRAREFIMKDLYSFHTSWECLDKTYQDVYDAYMRIFKRLGIPVEVVEAYSGPIGGDVSHEFMVVTKAGEDKFVKCTSCGYSASTEIAMRKMPSIQYNYTTNKNIQKIHTPNLRTVDELVNSLGVGHEKFIKSILYTYSGNYFLVLVRGDKEINPIKLLMYLGFEPEMASEKHFKELGSELGFIGPIGLENKNSLKIIADYSIINIKDAVIGANEKDYHYRGVDFDNIKIDDFADLSSVEDGDLCCKCGGRYSLFPALELGHIFKLGTKYSEPLEAYFTDKNGKLKPMIMGCYGIGVSRLVSAILEAYSTENLTVWTYNTAPFLVYILTINVDDQKQYSISEKIYQELNMRGIEVLWDDRSESPGTKFKDWELLGIPICVVVGSKIKDNVVEIKVNSLFPKTLNGNSNLFEKITLDLDIGQVTNYISEIKNKLDNIYNA
ncbi:MAG: proline--tRNA ligase [bacterium]